MHWGAGRCGCKYVDWAAGRCVVWDVGDVFLKCSFRFSPEETQHKSVMYNLFGISPGSQSNSLIKS